MKKIITALNNPYLSEQLNKYNNIEVVGKDIQYKEGIIDLLEKNNLIDMIIIYERILGEINLFDLINKIKIKNNKIDFLIILKKENKSLELKLKKNNINKILFKKNITEKILIEEILNKKETKLEKNENRKRCLWKKLKNNVKLLKSSRLININTEKGNKKVVFFGRNEVVKFYYMLILQEFLDFKNRKSIIIDINEKNEHIFKEFNNYIGKNYKIRVIKSINFYIKNKKFTNKNKIINNYLKKKIIIKNNNKSYINLDNKLLIEKIGLEKIFYYLENKYCFLIININTNNKYSKKILSVCDDIFLIITPNKIEIIESKFLIKRIKDQKDKIKIIINSKNLFYNIKKSIIKNVITK